MILRIGTLLLGIGLIGLGLGALLAPEASSEGYGVVSDDRVWIGATGLRDLVLGMITLVLRQRMPEALPYFLAPLILLPLGDVLLVLTASQPILHIAPHALGAIGIAVLAGLAWRTPNP